MKNNCIIRLERKEEYRKVENLTREAFWNVYRPGCSEHYVLNQLRNDAAFIPELDLCLEKDGELIGHVMYMHAHIEKEDGTRIPIMTFGPISIAPAYKRQGYYVDEAAVEKFDKQFPHKEKLKLPGQLFEY